MKTRSRPTWRLAFAWAALLVAPAMTLADEWPQWRGPNRDGVWREDGVVKRFAQKTLRHKWSVPLGSGYSGPTVADGRVYVMDRQVDPDQTEAVHAFDWRTGEKLWSHTYPCLYRDVGYVAGPRASVTIDDGRAYALGTMGHMHCFDSATGKILWKRDLGAEYKIEMPIWGIAASPLVDGELVILQIGGADGACLVALDKRTGEERWRALDDRASYSSPIIVEQAGHRVLVCWTGDSVAGIDPQSGAVHWRHPFEISRMVISITTPVVDDNRLFVSSFYDGSLMLELAADRLAVESVWRRKGPDEKITDSLHAMIGTPILAWPHVYGVDSHGELRCIDGATGDRVWESLDAVPKARWATIHMVRNGADVWMFNERGDLIIARLSPNGYEEISRAHLIDPTLEQLRQRDGVCWSHPAYAHRHVFARNDQELVCASLEAAE